MTITISQFSTLDDLYKYYNEELFDNKLPDCLVNMSRQRRAYGFFAPERWMDNQNKEIVHEISLNPDHINRSDIEWHSTLVHEMVHMWQQAFGNPGKASDYHNKQWAKEMQIIGLMPSNTGKEGGRKTGRSMSHYIIEGGPFEQAFNKIGKEARKGLVLRYGPNIPLIEEEEEEGEEKKPSRNGVKFKYQCSCKINVWGKADLALRCNNCESDFVQVEK